MSFIAYLCWLLGIAAPSDCDVDGYGAWVMDACAAADESQVEAPQDEGEHNVPPHHSRGTNISVSI